MENFFKAALGIGGLGTVGAAVFFGLYKQWLTLGIFSQLSGDQTFSIMIIFLVLVFLCAIVLIGAHALKGVKINSAKASNNSIAIINDKNK
ncbi:hypothetical protein MK852_13625 [Shewanella benthica]|uniref:hypothetical protein n=1 Tax=Shewanella benthica TaxID=43661 RepID=UPI00187B066D|nr:hypothetical protein [Shewanella benthica]MBE7214705.1 hypothetical protein [Shewanella benthica]MCL1063149.1 hypothetical protein [Shewanella benthica]